MSCEETVDELGALDLKFLQRRSIKYVSTSYTVLEADDIIVVNSEATITLPSATDNEGFTYTVKRLDSAGNVTIVPFGAELIDFEQSWVLNVDRYSLDFVSDGQNWIVI